MDNLSKFSERLSDLIFEKQITNQELANAIKVNVTAIQRWKREATKLYLSNAIAICDFFQCSLEFLTGRSETKIDFVPRSCPPFYERLRLIMEKQNKTRYRMTKESKFKENYFQRWKNGSEPQIPTLIELANYFDCTLDYLVGRE